MFRRWCCWKIVHLALNDNQSLTSQTTQLEIQTLDGEVYGVWRHFQQYFSSIVAVSFIGGRNQSTQRKPSTFHKSLTNGCQELLNLPQNPSSPPIFSGVRVTRSLVLCVCFVDRCLSFSFGHCVVRSFSIYGFWLPLWYLQTLLLIQTVDSNNLGKYYYFGGIKMNSMLYREVLILLQNLLMMKWNKHKYIIDRKMIFKYIMHIMFVNMD